MPLTPDRAVRRLYAATLVSAFGNGLVIPFLVVYLHEVRSIPLGVAGLVVAWEAVIGFAIAPVAGAMVDRFGPRPVLLVSPLVNGAGMALLAFVHTAPQAFAATTVIAAGSAAGWPAITTLLARLSGEEERQRVFGLQFLFLNLGIGLGGLVSGLIVDSARPVTYQALYLADATGYLLYVLFVASLRGLGGPLPPPGRQPSAAEPVPEPGPPAGYREVLRDPALQRYAVVALVMLTSGYGALTVGYPAFVTQVLDQAPRWVAFGFVANTAAIVVGQLAALRLVQGRSRSIVLALVGVVWASAWALLGAASLLDPRVLVLAVVLAVPAVFAVGETLWQPVAPAVLNDLAPEHLRGRYNAVGSLTWNVAGTLGPAVAGLLIGAGRPSLWIGVVVAGSLLGSVLALRLRRVLTPLQDGTAMPDPPDPGLSVTSGERLPG